MHAISAAHMPVSEIEAISRDMNMAAHTGGQNVQYEAFCHTAVVHGHNTPILCPCDAPTAAACLSGKSKHRKMISTASSGKSAMLVLRAVQLGFELPNALASSWAGSVRQLFFNMMPICNVYLWQEQRLGYIVNYSNTVV